jgi:hypothetical protein
MRRLAVLLFLAGCGPSTFENERAASAALKTLASAEADFRGNDRDGNKIQDFWTGDVAGLYYLKPQGSGEPIKLIEQGVADADPSRPGAKPYHGYWFIALDNDESGDPYRTETSGWGTEGQLKYNHSKFGFCAYPAEPDVTGQAVFMLNEGNTIFKNTKKKGPILKWPSEDGEDEVPPGAPLPLLKSEADGLKGTSILPVLDFPHESGKNLMWCVTVKVAWDVMLTDLGTPAAKLKNGPAYVAKLNAPPPGKDLLKDAWYVAVVGEIGQGVGQEIAAAMRAKFPGVPVPITISGEPEDRIAFAYLRRLLPFKTPFERYPEEFKFDGRPVSAFGLRSHGPRAAALSQVIVRSYASQQDFTVELTTSSEDDRMIVARLPKKETLLETVKAAVARADAGEGKAMESQDELRVPCLNLDVEKRFWELEGKDFVDSGIGKTLKEALQVNQLRLDENGVKLVSYMKFQYSVLNGDYTPPPPPPPKKLICDGPFLFMLMMKGAKLPYFALWIENAELLCPR